MEILEKIGDAASKTYKYTAEKTSKFAKETKIKMQINEHKGDIKELYREIGEAVYEKYVVDENIDIEFLKEKCEEIKNLSDEIVKCKDEILKLNEKRQCKNCYEEIGINANYCPNCGFQQEEIVDTKEEAVKEKIVEENNDEVEENKEELAENQEKTDISKEKNKKTRNNANQDSNSNEEQTDIDELNEDEDNNEED